MTALMYKVYENQEPRPSGPLYYLFRSLVVTFFLSFFPDTLQVTSKAF